MSIQDYQFRPWCSGRALVFNSRGPRFESGRQISIFKIFFRIPSITFFSSFPLFTDMADHFLKMAGHKCSPHININSLIILKVSLKFKKCTVEFQSFQILFCFCVFLVLGWLNQSPLLFLLLCKCCYGYEDYENGKIRPILDLKVDFPY